MAIICYIYMELRRRIFILRKFVRAPHGLTQSLTCSWCNIYYLRSRPVLHPLSQIIRSYSSMGSLIAEDTLLGVGNPLLDMTVTGPDAEWLLKEYDLLPNNAIIATKKHESLFKKCVEECKPIYLAGGATQNTIRVAQWLLQQPKATTFFGAVGNDMYEEILFKKATEIGVNVKYDIHSDKSTGKCCAIITGEDRSLVTDLGAAQMFNVDFLHKPENWDLVEKAKYFYIGGFTLPESKAAALKILKHAAENDKVVIMNLHATFLCSHFADFELNILQYVDVLFGNGDEARELSKEIGFGTSDIKQIAQKTVNYMKLNKRHGRTVIFTQGRSPTIVGRRNEIKEIPVVPVEKHLIKDTNGCGDSFVGGFLSQFVQGKTTEICLKCGTYAAREVIQNYGCNFPEKPNFVVE
ncbi:uncharacterized protein LOC134267903 [Saccostrea cucullata]|uniref:uncharacterized protein LOC134267903 n=1 Tax=Saccostrea cuccullata TaxID=36930 RepID=UPI002ECFC4C7